MVVVIALVVVIATTLAVTRVHGSQCMHGDYGGGCYGGKLFIMKNKLWYFVEEVTMAVVVVVVTIVDL